MCAPHAQGPLQNGALEREAAVGAAAADAAPTFGAHHSLVVHADLSTALDGATGRWSRLRVGPQAVIALLVYRTKVTR